MYELLRYDGDDEMEVIFSSDSLQAVWDYSHQRPEMGELIVHNRVTGSQWSVERINTCE